MTIFACVVSLLLAQALMGPVAHANYFEPNRPGYDIESLCLGRTIQLTRLVELKMLNERMDESVCSQHVRDAAREMFTLIDEGQHDLCSENSVQKFRDFYAKYLDTSSSAARPNREELLLPLLPKSLQQFVFAYGMQMSLHCKREMIEVLARGERQGSELINEDDLAHIKSLTGEGSPVARMLGVLVNPEQGVFLPSDLAPFVAKHGRSYKNNQGEEKICVQSTTSAYVHRLQTVCERRFKPIYAPLMMPIVKLANLGFEYQPRALREELRSEQVARRVGQWSRIVFMCEALNNIRLVDVAQDVQGDNRLVRILTEEEAAAIESTTSAPNRQQAATGDQQVVFADIELATYVPRKVVLNVIKGNVLYDKKDSELKKAVSAHKTSRGEEELIKQRMVSRAMLLLKQEIKQGHFGLLFSAGWKGLLHRVRKGGQYERPSEMIVKMLDEVVERQKVGGDAPVSYQRSDLTAKDQAIGTFVFFAAIILIVGVVIGLAFLAHG